MTQDEPRLQVINGDASPEEVAAVLAVLSVVGEAPEEAPTRRTSWGRPAMRPSVRASADGWRRSGLPR